MRDRRFREMAGTKYYEAEGYPLPNINRLLGNYPGVDGVKVGYTGKAGRTMVASATQDGHRVYVSIMRSEDLVTDETALLNWVWRTFRWE
jgi:D-alanyl-D-alanine carboxypeptidase